MKTETYIRNEAMVKKLNQLLSDSQVYYQNLRAFHWLVKGPQFYQLHGLFEQMYNQVNDDIDDIAERILMVGGSPLHSFDDYLSQARLKPARDLSLPTDILPVVVANKEQLLVQFREIMALAGEIGDEGSASLMSAYIGAAEKELWMLNSLRI